MRLAEFRDRVRQTFGPRLERATPAGVREFLDALQLELHRESGSPQVHEVSDPGLPAGAGYEEVMLGFFDQALDYPPEKAVVLLWLLAFEQHFAVLSEHYEQRFPSIFGEIDLGQG